MSETRDAERPASFEDRRMWRLLLARLHPDAGGDHALFAFASAIRDEMSSFDHAERSAAGDESARSEEDRVAPFLRTWQDAMGHWSSNNRDALKDFWAG